ncbi:hypothetical protein GDO81_028672 [Engystomops pustulosus]|uniref:Uncharacterized protein n=1 Tax=Engystomops pustulosus TaxID=76066 RepID=A0AAV6ZCR8_ENGPU|nr:hypothetical protein GDO81_028672 [Engystomops pustulosus]
MPPALQPWHWSEEVAKRGKEWAPVPRITPSCLLRGQHISQNTHHIKPAQKQRHHSKNMTRKRKKRLFPVQTKVL